MCYQCVAPYLAKRDTIKFKPPHIDSKGVIKFKVKNIGLSLNKPFVRVKQYLTKNMAAIDILDFTKEYEINVSKLGYDNDTLSMNDAVIISIFDGHTPFPEAWAII